MANKQADLIDAFRMMTDAGFKPNTVVMEEEAYKTLGGWHMFRDYINYLDKIENPETLANTLLKSEKPISIHALLKYGHVYFDKK